MRTLLTKLAGTLLLILILVGSALFALERYSSQAYFEELTQRLNAPIAMYVTGAQVLMQNGQVDTGALTALASQAMVINPSVEIYLLDTRGRILGHALPGESVRLEQVDLAPVKRFLSGAAELPLRGSDPRSLQRRKIFSAAEVRSDGQLQGYLYAVLGGQKYDQLADSIRDSYVRKMSVGAIVAIISVAFLIALLVFRLLTRRLTRLTELVQSYAETGAEHQARLSQPGHRGDEIERLGSAFGAMSTRIQEQFEQLKENDRLRRELVSNVSHDLRTPLTAIQGYVDTLLLKNDVLSESKRQQYLEITRRHSQRLGHLVADLFELSKLESARVAPTLETFSLAELLQDVAQQFEWAAAEKGVTIDVRVGAQRMRVVADIGLVQRVLENLLKNAIQNTPQGGRVTLGVKPQGERLVVAVTDTGRGIPESQMPLIFDRFYRAEPEEPESGSSSGLGLAIVKRILELHGSRIVVNSEVDHGTCFEFDLPAGGT